jgi:hypothetical protein
MGFQTPKYDLSDLLQWTTTGKVQLPDFQRGYKWEDERIRQLLVTVLRGHPLGAVMLLKTGNDQVRFKPKPIEGVTVPEGTDAELLLLDGQQRLTSLTQALTGDGVVDTKDARGKLLSRKYYVDIRLALEGEDRIDEAVKALPYDGIVRTNFGRDIEFDVSTPEREREHGYFPLSLLFSDDAFGWVMAWTADTNDHAASQAFHGAITTARKYEIPAIELDTRTSKSAVATVFEKVNTGGLSLTVFELLTATFAGDKAYYDEHGEDFRLNDDWQETHTLFQQHPVLAGIENTDFLQAVSILATRRRHHADLAAGKSRPAAISAKREDVLRITLAEYLEWVGPLREAFVWASSFLADRHIFDARFVPYPKQLVPLAVIRVVLGSQADLIGPKKQLVRWFWCGILGELYGGSIETRFVRDVEQVPRWVESPDDTAVLPQTVRECAFVESRLHSLRTRNAAAYKGIYALLLANQARDWMEDKALDKVQYKDLKVDIHHIFPKHWCNANGIDDEHRESIVNKTAISARTNKTIGGTAPSAYLAKVEDRAGIDSTALDALLSSHLVPAPTLRSDDFEAFFAERRELLCRLIEQATGKTVQRDVEEGRELEGSAEFEPEPEDDDEVAAVAEEG